MITILMTAGFACGFYLGAKWKGKSYERGLKQINDSLDQRIINIQKNHSQNNSSRKRNVD